MSDDSPNIQQNNEQILNDIQTLQSMEQQLFSNLETNTNLTSQEQQQIINNLTLRLERLKDKQQVKENA